MFHFAQTFKYFQFFVLSVFKIVGFYSADL